MPRSRVVSIGRAFAGDNRRVAHIRFEDGGKTESRLQESSRPSIGRSSLKRVGLTINASLPVLSAKRTSACPKRGRCDWRPWLRQINPSGRISLSPLSKSLFDSRHPVPEQGALAIVTERWDGMRWTRRHRARDGIAGRDKLRERLQDVPTSGAEAYGEVVWF